MKPLDSFEVSREARLPAPNEVHVWAAWLGVEADRLGCLRCLMTPDEVARAERFRFPRDRDRFTAARGILRELLGRCLSADPRRLRFSYGPRGKPAMAGEHEGALRFNLAHSAEIALYAVARGRDVGVDVERIRPEVAGEEIAARFFSPREAGALRALPPESRLEAFFNCWTRKEAYIKARGEGLGIRLDSFDVTLAPGEPAALLATRDDPQEAARWTLAALRPASGYVACVAAAGSGWDLICRFWQGA